ncbi:hypothetical protein Deipe_4471 (plasmid) [Deinococcus peraridilitoris DSM 19664]|uniref:Uncharacterized protein n=1 Tax=Deinococcus peraridilitoris (strain DSM 19664 / LMG 22246 / CIP 109416 / KR-200) TaxID=937777 RepID=L0A7K2_DEIPD|nr:hypothetical protein Deipe_4471 [Deinococcus peraridilitoris DSM 19664]
MRLVTVRAPEGQGQHVAGVAFTAGITEVGVHRAQALTPDGEAREQDVVEFSTATPQAKRFIEALMVAPFYDPASFSFSIRHPQSIFGNHPPRQETHPVVRPSVDVYDELWQFTKVTFSLTGRVFLSSVLLAYGMVEDHLPLIIAGLLFLPYHHHMLGIALGAVLRERHFIMQALLALLITTALIVLAGAGVALAVEPPIEFNQFGAPLSGVILSLVIGAAAGLGSIDDAGRRELIGLAATAHIAVHPAWFGLQLVYGLGKTTELPDHLLMFALNVTALIVAAAAMYVLSGMRGDGIRGFISRIGRSPS